MMRGTIEYADPSMIISDEITFAIDYYSLGLVIYEMLTAGEHPFKKGDRSAQDIMLDIVQNKIPMKEYFSDNAKDLITRLTTADLSKRLGCGKSGSQEIKDHPFFQGIDWVKLLRREVEPHYKPKLKDECDTSKIDTDFTNNAIKRTPTNERAVRQLEEDQFEDANIPDFQFVNPKVIQNWKKAQEDKDFF